MAAGACGCQPDFAHRFFAHGEHHVVLAVDPQGKAPALVDDHAPLEELRLCLANITHAVGTALLLVNGGEKAYVSVQCCLLPC